EAATRVWADEEAAGHYDRALQALDLAAKPDERRRCEMLLALGEAQARASNTANARETFERAASLARKLALPDQFARAALGIGSELAMGVRFGKVVALEVQLVEEALLILDEGQRALRMRVLAS